MLARKTRYPVMPAAGETPAESGDAFKAPKSTDARLLVRNSNSADIEVHLIAESGRRFRLGKVHRMSNRTFVLPARLVNGGTKVVVKVYAFSPPAAGSAMRSYLQGVESKPFSAAAGEDLTLEVTAPLTDSYVHK
jgi:hypothetical protein